MTRAVRTGVITLTLLAVVLVAATAFAAGEGGLRRIVVFRDGTPAPLQQDVVAISGSRLIRALPLINGVAIALPATNTAAALEFLRTHPTVSAVHTDPRFGVHGTILRDTAAAGAGGDGAGGDGAGGDGAGGDGAGGDGAGGDGAGGDGAGGDGAGGDGAGGDGAGGDGAGGDGAGGDRVVFVTPVVLPRGEFYPWGIDRIGASDLHEGRDRLLGDGVKIAVFDTGIDRRHRDLRANIIGGFNAIDGANPTDWNDDNGHGTAMAGIIAARLNRAGVVGGAPRAKLFAVKVLDRNGQGLTSDTIYALGELSARPDIRLINMSYGTSLVWPLFQVAIKRATELGKIIVTSRGNRCTSSAAQGAGGDGAGGDGAGGDGAGGDGAGGDGAGGDGAGGDSGCTCMTSRTAANGAGGDGAGGDGAGGDGAGGDGAGGDGAGGDSACATAVKYPAAYPEVITVGASTIGDNVPSYSLSGGVDVVAPGGDSAEPIITTNLGGGYGAIIGTSPAAAHVTAAIALALDRRPRLTLDQTVELLQRTATPLACPECTVERQGAGLVDVREMADELSGRRSNGRGRGRN